MVEMKEVKEITYSIQNMIANIIIAIIFQIPNYSKTTRNLKRVMAEH